MNRRNLLPYKAEGVGLEPTWAFTQPRFSRPVP